MSSHLLVTIKYSPPGLEPQMNTVVVPIYHHLALDDAVKRVREAYNNQSYTSVTVTKFQ